MLCVLRLDPGVPCTDDLLNEYGEPVDFECDEGYGLTCIHSFPVRDPAVTDPDPDDRRWSFACGIKVRLEFRAFFMCQLLPSNCFCRCNKSVIKIEYLHVY